MRFRDLLGLALAALAQQKLRTVLTTLGVLFGSYVLVASLSIGQGVQETIDRESQRLGELRHIEVFLSHVPSEEPPFRSFEHLTFDDPARQARVMEERRHRWRAENPARLIPLSPKRVREIRGWEHVTAVEPVLTGSLRITDPPREEVIRFSAIEPDDRSFRERLVLGRMPRIGKREVLINEYLLYQMGIMEDTAIRKKLGEKLTLQPPEGRRVSPRFLLNFLGMAPQQLTEEQRKVLRKLAEQLPKTLASADLTKEERAILTELLADMPVLEEPPKRVLTIVGVFRPLSAEEREERRTSEHARSDLALTFEDAEELTMGGRPAESGTYQRATVVVDSLEHVKEVVERIEATGLRARSLLEFVERTRFTYLLIFSSMQIVAMIALLVAALGITNTMLMSVLERTREIGIMKAVGAREGQIQALFLIEGALIGFIGGVLGLGLAWLSSFPGDAWVRSIVNEKLSFELTESIFVLPPWILFGAPIFACLMTTLAALLPARRAAKVNPVTALRHE